MLDWTDISVKIEQALGDIKIPTFLGTPISAITPALAAQVATAAIREDVESHIRSLPTVPTNKYDLIMSLSAFALIGGSVVGFGYLMYKFDKNEVRAREGI